MKIVSGIRPTGNIHLGNYLGVLRQVIDMEDCFFFVADLHSKSSEVEATIESLAAIGIDAHKESDYSEGILSLYHELSFDVPMGVLKRMTQFKDKSETEDATLALFSYPVLMAADIFYFGGTHIPIGSDQRQHIEFVRDLAKKTGRVVPEMIIGDYPRIMSLTDGTKKMSKSEPNDFSRININDSPALIEEKIMKAKSACEFNDSTPEMINLRNIYVAVGGTNTFTKVKDFKEELASLVVKQLLGEDK